MEPKDGGRLKRRKGDDILLLNAIGFHDFPRVKELLDDGNVEYEEKDTLHMICGEPGRHDIVEYLITERGYNTNGRNMYGQIPLHIASSRCDVRKVKLLLNNGSLVNAKDNFYNFTPLHCAAGMCRSVLFNVSKNTTENIFPKPDVEFYMTPIMSILQELLAHGADCNIRDKCDMTAFDIAMACGGKDLIELFLNWGYNLHASGPTYGMTALHHAANSGNIQAVGELLKRGCNPNAKNIHQETPLFLAVKCNGVFIVKMLVNRGCEINAANVFGCTPLHDAAHYGNVECVDLLVKYKQCNINARNRKGHTPLSALLNESNPHNNYRQVVRILLQNGADPNIEPRAGNVLKAAICSDHSVEMAQLILKHGYKEINFQTSDFFPIDEDGINVVVNNGPVDNNERGPDDNARPLIDNVFEGAHKGVRLGYSDGDEMDESDENYGGAGSDESDSDDENNINISNVNNVRIAHKKKVDKRNGNFPVPNTSSRHNANTDNGSNSHSIPHGARERSPQPGTSNNANIYDNNSRLQLPSASNSGNVDNGNRGNGLPSFDINVDNANREPPDALDVDGDEDDYLNMSFEDFLPDGEWMLSLGKETVKKPKKEVSMRKTSNKPLLIGRFPDGIRETYHYDDGSDDSSDEDMDSSGDESGRNMITFAKKIIKHSFAQDLESYMVTKTDFVKDILRKYTEKRKARAERRRLDELDEVIELNEEDVEEHVLVWLLDTDTVEDADRPRLLDLLVRWGSDLNSRDKDGNCLLQSALYLGECYEVEETIAVNVIKKAAAGYYMSQDNIDLLPPRSDFNGFGQRCRDEIVFMKRTPIIGSLTFYDFIRNDPNSLTEILTPPIIELFESKHYYTSFPAYADVIEVTYTKVLYRKSLLNKCNPEVSVILGQFNLPTSVLNHILSFVKTGDLLPMSSRF